MCEVTMTESPDRRLARLLSRSEDRGSLAEAALLLAQHDYPGLDVARYLLQLSEMAHTVKQRLRPEANAPATVFELNRFLFDEHGFAGDTEDYYDPRNSYLNEVMDRRRGIPITLSVVYIEVGRRIGLPLEGVSFPGHFLVKFAVEGGDIVLDSFAGGVSLTEEDLEFRIEQTFGQQAAARAPLGRFLGAASHREILVRMLRNLKAIHTQNGRWDTALSIIDRILVIDPEQSVEWRDRGTVYEHMECARSALANYRRYLEIAPAAEDVDDIRRRVH
jgi:regulator of sirC expression with transglutaminase-like and TPR domain